MSRYSTLTKHILILPFTGLIWLYQAISPLFFGPSCRFTPSCSAYASQAFTDHGIGRGIYLSMKRILRCHPWGSYGIDPVPHRESIEKTRE